MNRAIGIVLAAGKGTRMNSDLPKVLFPVLGRPMIHYVLAALRTARVRPQLVVIGYQADLVRETLQREPDVICVEQREQLGTGHAVQMCRPYLASYDGPVLIVTGDSPLIQSRSVDRLLDAFERARPACVLGTLHKAQPAGLGRIVRDAQQEFSGIVEEKDATPEQRAIDEVNMSTYVFDCRRLLWALDRLDNRNRQGEYYLTDCPGLLRQAGDAVRALAALEPCEALSINTPDELAAVEAEMRGMRSG